jgi:hypothetical protein
MKYTANLGQFAVDKIVSEYAERIYAYMEKTQRYIKRGYLGIYWSNMKILFDPLFLWKMGWMKPKNNFTLLSR